MPDRGTWLEGRKSRPLGRPSGVQSEPRRECDRSWKYTALIAFRHREERSDEAIQILAEVLDGFGSLAMTDPLVGARQFREPPLTGAPARRPALSQSIKVP
jgi:hypothetical protein